MHNKPQIPKAVPKPYSLVSSSWTTQEKQDKGRNRWPAKKTASTCLPIGLFGITL